MSRSTYLRLCLDSTLAVNLTLILDRYYDHIWYLTRFCLCARGCNIIFFIESYSQSSPFVCNQCSSSSSSSPPPHTHFYACKYKTKMLKEHTLFFTGVRLNCTAYKARYTPYSCPIMCLMCSVVRCYITYHMFTGLIDFGSDKCTLNEALMKPSV